MPHTCITIPAPQMGKVNRNGWMRDPKLQKEPWTCLQGGTGGFLNSIKCFSFEIKMKKMGGKGSGSGGRVQEGRNYEGNNVFPRKYWGVLSCLPVLSRAESRLAACLCPQLHPGRVEKYQANTPSCYFAHTIEMCH